MGFVLGGGGGGAGGGGGGGGETSDRDAADGEGGTRWCLQCGGEWVDQLDECPDCEVPLVDENPFVELAPPEEGAAHIEYELSEWATESRILLDQLLSGERIAHVWQGAALIVAEGDEERVDELVEQVEVTTLPTLDPDLERVAFTLEDWTEDQVGLLGERLDQLGIPWELDVEGELVVHAHQADEVEVALEEVEHPDALPVDDGVASDADDDGGDDDDEEEDGVEIDPDAVFGGLFVACDRLAKDSRDHKGVLGAVEANRTLSGARAPYGLAPTTWNDLKRRSRHLVTLLEDDGSTDEQIELAAGELRTLLRTLV